MNYSQLSATLPSPSELDQVFSDFKEVLRVARYHTPLQRVNRLHCSQSELSLFLKQSAETESVFNLLRPGHNTCLRVDLMRVIASTGENCHIRVPATLLSRGNEVILMKNNPAGEVVYRVFPSLKAALPVLSKETANTSLPGSLFPRYLHKSPNTRSSLLSSAKEIPPLWHMTAPNPQYAQQFIQPFTKTVSLVRAHWKASRKVATFYFLSRGPERRSTKPCIVTQIPDLGMARSFSEVMRPEIEVCINRASSNLVVRKTKFIPELDQTIHKVVQLLNGTIGRSRKVVETVCDFVCNYQHQWVLLACKGFSFEEKGEMRITTLQQPEEKVDLRFLMYPLVARRAQVKQRLARKLRAASVLINRRDAVIGNTHNPEGHIKPESTDSSPLLPPQDVKEEPAVSIIPMLEREILTREVGRLEKLLQGSRKYKQVLKSTLDIVQKYGGSSHWQSALHSLYRTFYSSPDITVYFEEQVGFEECSHMLNVILRIIRGDYNFYYKEALRRLHARHCISKAHFQCFLSAMRGIMEDAGIVKGDIETVIVRFAELEQYLCANRYDVVS